jgi:hypothetical protein
MLRIDTPAYPDLNALRTEGKPEINQSAFPGQARRSREPLGSDVVECADPIIGAPPAPVTQPLANRSKIFRHD